MEILNSSDVTTVAFKDVVGDIIERNMLFNYNFFPACQMSLLFVFKNDSSLVNY